MKLNQMSSQLSELHNQMSHILIQQASFIHKFVEKEGNLNQSRVENMGKLMKSVAASLQETGGKMLRAKDKFSRLCQSDTNQNNCIKDLVEYGQDLLKTIARIIQDMGNHIKKQIVGPLDKFYSDIQISNKKNLDVSLEIIEEVNTNLQRLENIERNFTQKKLTLLKKNYIFKSEEHKYKGEMISTNEAWPAIQYRYTKFLEDLDISNQSRCEFTKKIVVQFSRILNRLPQSEEVERRLVEFQRIPYEQYEVEESLVLQIQHLFGRSQLLRPLKIFESVRMKYLQQGHLMKLKEIQSFSETYLLKQTSQLSTKTRSLILQSLQMKEYFLSCICCKLHTQKVLPKQKYNDLLTIVKYILVECMLIPDNQIILYGILYLSMRIVNQGVSMIKELSNASEFWESEARWDLIYSRVYDHLTKSHFLRKKSTSLRMQKTQSIMRRNSNGARKIQLDHANNQKYQALREINILITQLELTSEFTIGYITKKSAELGLPRNHIESLLIYQQQTKRNSLSNFYFSNRATIQRKTQHLQKTSRLGIVYAIRKSLKYLNIKKDHIHKLRLVCRKWNQHLKTPIFRRYLSETNLNTIEKMRATIYRAVIPQAYTFSLYKRMLAEVPDDFSMLQQIDMDVRRSLNNKPELRSSLRNMLVVFSFYNEKIGYLQGMNYIGENILKLGNSPQSAYCTFEYLLRKYFSVLFAGNLENLKVKLYQFMRLMERYLPNLYKHFQNQKIESEHFLVPWIVTLWGQMEGDIVWLMWDGFLIDGWKWWTKVCLWLLSIFEADLLQMNFEEILKFFSDLASNAFFKCKFNDFFMYALSPLKIKDEINEFKVTNKMLQLLQNEYLFSQKKYKEFMTAE